MQYADGSKEDRIATVLSAPNETKKQFLASPVIPDGTGAAQADRLQEVLEAWELVECIIGQVCDTTASNTGYMKGAATLLERILGRPIFWFGCRHHTGELHIGHAYIACRGNNFTKGKDNALFKRLHNEWAVLEAWIEAHPGDYVRWDWPLDANSWKHKRGDEVLAWARTFMVNGNFRRGDHRELLELVVVYLGGVVLRPRKNKDPKAVETYVLNRPIATNQTRFMGIALHELKIALLGPQFEQDAVGQEQTTALAEVLCLLYAPYFLQARLASAAPRLDRDLYVRLVQYRRLHDEGSLHYAMAEAMRFSLLRHTWFLTQELVPFYLWDENVPTRERKAVADVLLRVNPPAVWETGKPNLPNILPDKPRLQDIW